MAHEISPFAQLIDLWPSVAALADDLDEKYPTVAAWKQRGSIPPDYWDRLIPAATKRGIRGVSWESLARIANGQPVPNQKGGGPAQPLPTEGAGASPDEAAANPATVSKDFGETTLTNAATERAVLKADPVRAA